MARYLPKSLKAVADYFGSGDETALSTEPTPDGDSVYLDTNSVDIAHDWHHKLGEGAFARVYEGRYRGQPCAVKVFKEDVLKNQNDIESYICGLSNPNIIRIHGLWLDPYKDRNALSIVMELCDTSLYEYIRSHRVRGIPKSDKLKILHDVTTAMIYLHSQHIVYGDLRSPNVLLVNTRSRVESSDEQPQITAKVADFDLARHVDPKTHTHYTTTFADEDYLPPEAIDEDRKHVRLSFSVDVFCFGPLAIELACMEFPKPAVKVERKKGLAVKFRDEIERREKYLKKIDFTERMYTDLIVKQCMAERPEERGSFLDLQLIIEAFQKKMQDRPDQELLEEKQAEIFDMHRKMEEDAKTLVDLETLREELEDMAKYNEELQEKPQQAEKDLARVTTERDIQKSNHEDSQKSISECHVKLGQKEEEIKRIQENWQLSVAEKDKYSREAVEAKNQLTVIKKKADELERSLHSAETQREKLEDMAKCNEELQDVQKSNHEDSLKSLSDCHVKLGQKEEEIKRIQENWQLSVAEKDKYSREAVEAKNQLTVIKKKADELERSLHSAEAQLKEGEEKLRAAEEEKTSLSTRLTKTEESLKDTKGLLASLKEENTRLHEALDHDPQGKLLKKLHDDLQVVRTGVMDMSGEMRRVNEQLPDPASRVGELEAQLKEKEDKLRAAEEEKTLLNTRLMKAEESLEDTKNENISLKNKQVGKDTELNQVKQQLADVRQQLVRTVQRKEEDERLIEKALEGMREQQMVMMKDILSHLNVPSLAGVPLLDSGDEDETFDKEKLLSQIEDLQKQLKEKEGNLNKTLSRLTEMSEERKVNTCTIVEHEELREQLSLKEMELSELRIEHDRLREQYERMREENYKFEDLQLIKTKTLLSQSEDLSQKLARSKECIKALENMLTNLVLWENPAEEGIEQISSDIHGVDAIETVAPGLLAHESELKKLCWIPFGIQTLTVGQEGGLFPLQPQSKGLSEDRDVIMLEVPENAVNTDVCDELCIRYGVIVYGPFDVPEGYQLGSMAVYIYFEEDHTVKPVLLHLPHWSGKDGESSLKCAIAPHRLEEGEEKYKFRLTEDGDFHSTEGSGVIAIDGHCSLFVTAFDEGASSKFLAVSFEKENVKGSTLDVVITFAHDVWCKILTEHYSPASLTCCVPFEFGAKNIIEGRLQTKDGDGWQAWTNGTTQVALNDLNFASYGIRNSEELEDAVTKQRRYPPSISCLTTYHNLMKKFGDPTNAVLEITGADKPMEFVCTAYKYRSSGHLLKKRTSSPSQQSSVSSDSYDKMFSSKYFMNKYMDAESLEVVEAEEIASRLEVSQTCPLPSRVCNSIRRANSEEDAARELFKHFQKQGTPDTIRSLCDVMTELRGYANMKRLGEKMKNDEDLSLPYEDI